MKLTTTTCHPAGGRPKIRSLSEIRYRQLPGAQSCW